MENKKNTNPESKKWNCKAFFLNKYTITTLVFLVWIGFIDNASLLVISDLNKEIKSHEEKLLYYQNRLKEHSDFYEKLIKDKSEKEKFARENYFMKKSNEEIFILVADSTKVDKTKK